MTPLTVTVPLARERHPAVGRNRMYAAITSGALPAVKVGKRLAIPIDELDRWVMSGCPTRTPPREHRANSRAAVR